MMIKYFIIGGALVASILLALFEEAKTKPPEADATQWANRLVEYIDSITIDLAKERFHGLVKQGFPPAQAFEIVIGSAQ